MNATEAIDKIVKLLGLKFQKESFFRTYLKDGETEITNNMEGDFAVGQTLYVVGESTLSPAPKGEHTTREGLILVVDAESTIFEMKSEIDEAIEEVQENENQMEGSKEKVKMVEAKDAQGNILESDTFDVGEMVYVVGADGEKTPAPNGEHQVVLKDSEGNEVKIRIQTEDGKIIQRENVEEMSEKTPTDFSSQFESIKESINTLISVVDSLNGKFKTDISSLKSDFESFKKQPERKPIERKLDLKDSFADFKVDFLKQIKK
jgi:hypothetical protein